MTKEKLIQYCSLETCDNQPVKEKVGNVTHSFCCAKGFEKSLLDFSNSIIDEKAITKQP